MCESRCERRERTRADVSDVCACVLGDARVREQMRATRAEESTHERRESTGADVSDASAREQMRGTRVCEATNKLCFQRFSTFDAFCKEYKLKLHCMLVILTQIAH